MDMRAFGGRKSRRLKMNGTVRVVVDVNFFLGRKSRRRSSPRNRKRKKHQQNLKSFYLMTVYFFLIRRNIEELPFNDFRPLTVKIRTGIYMDKPFADKLAPKLFEWGIYT